jgi:hypothetical protein
MGAADIADEPGFGRRCRSCHALSSILVFANEAGMFSAYDARMA